MGVKAVILVGGPSKGTRFRPLSLDIPKPLFPVAGQELVLHHLDACRQLENLQEVILMGFYNDQEAAWQTFLKKASASMGVPVRYLKEESRLGTAGGLKRFKGEILSGNPDYIVLMHCDILCTFPIKEILEFHKKHGKEITILGKKVPKEEASNYGCLAIDEETNEALHYAEKPETFIGETINAGIYALSPSFFDLVDKGYSQSILMLVAVNVKLEEGESEKFLRLEQDVLMKVCGDKHVYVYRTPGFWLQLKSAGMVVFAARHMLEHLREVNPERLTRSGDGKAGPLIVGDVLIHPSAQIDPTAKIGPNVSIGENVKVGPGVRIQHSIILDGAEIKAHSCVMYAIVGWRSVVGQWVRLEGLPDFSADSHDALKCGVTILGSGVTVGAESIMRSSIALPNKDLSGSYHNLILL